MPSWPTTPSAVAAYVERLPPEVLALFGQAVSAEQARRLAAALAASASSINAAQLAEKMTPAEYAEEVGVERRVPWRWACAGKVRQWDGRKAPRGSWVEADPRKGAKREAGEP